MKSILIIGATGSIGVYASVLLKEQGYKVYAVGRRKSDNGFFETYGIPYYSVEISKAEQFSLLPQACSMLSAASAPTVNVTSWRSLLVPVATAWLRY